MRKYYAAVNSIISQVVGAVQSWLKNQLNIMNIVKEIMFYELQLIKHYLLFLYSRLQ